MDSTTANEDEDSSEDDWVPGQDVQINYKAILEILTATLDSPLGTFAAPTTSQRQGWLLVDRKITRLNSSHKDTSRMPSSA